MGIAFGVKELPKIKIGSKTYYIDIRLCELRNVDNPHDVLYERRELLEIWVRQGIKEI